MVFRRFLKLQSKKLKVISSVKEVFPFPDFLLQICRRFGQYIYAASPHKTNLTFSIPNLSQADLIFPETFIQFSILFVEKCDFFPCT